MKSLYLLICFSICIGSAGAAQSAISIAPNDTIIIENIGDSGKLYTEYRTPVSESHLWVCYSTSSPSEIESVWEQELVGREAEKREAVGARMFRKPSWERFCRQMKKDVLVAMGTHFQKMMKKMGCKCWLTFLLDAKGNIAYMQINFTRAEIANYIRSKDMYRLLTELSSQIHFPARQEYSEYRGLFKFTVLIENHEGQEP